MIDQTRLQGTPYSIQRLKGWYAQPSIIITLILGFLGVGAIYAVTRIDSVDSIPGPLVIVLAPVLLIVAWRNWQIGVQTLLVTIIVEGAVRKWFLPSYAEIVYFYKDILMVVILIRYLMQRNKLPFLAKQQFKLFFGILGAFVLYSFAIILNPKAPHPLVSLIGIKVYCLYMPLIVIVPRMFPSKEKLIKFLQWYLVIVLAVAALGALQFVDGSAESPLNRYAWREDLKGNPQDTAVFADAEGSYFVRITSSFSFITGLTVYLPVMFALLLGLTSLHELKSLPFVIKSIYYAALGGAVVTAFMSGSRGVIVSLLIVALVFFGFTSARELLRRLRQFAIGAVIICLTIVVVAPQSIDALYTRAFGGEEQLEEGRARMLDVFRFPAEEAQYAGAFGYGIGATQNGVPALMKRFDLVSVGEQIPIPFESESSRVMLELGVVGFLLFALLRLSILITLWSACLSIRDYEHKTLAVAAFAALIYPLIAGGAVAIHTQNIYQWFLIGVVFALFNIDRLALVTNRSHRKSNLQIWPTT